MVVVTRDELDTIIAAAVRAGLADIHRRPQLFLGLPLTYAPSLQGHMKALDQLRWDLDDLNRHPALEGHPLPPLVTWLRNAEGMALPPEAAVFRGFCERLTPSVPTAAAPPAVPGTRNLVFVAYDHRDEALKDTLLPQLAPLRRWCGMEVWDDRQLKAADEWYPRIRDVLGRTRVALCLVSKHFLDSDFCMDEELPYLLQQHWAGQLEVLPILVGPCAWKRHPWLARLDAWPADDAALARLVEAIGDALDRGGPVVPIAQHPLPLQVDLSRLPESGHLLLGRAAEWNLLDAALLDPATRMVVLRAPGGVGKSTLVKVWSDALQSRGLPGLERAYAWSFYSQGTGERVTSADLFIAKALEFFGDPDPKQGDPWEKGERLAGLIAAKPTLLVLDGLEPLQEGGTTEHRIKDPSLLTLLEGLTDKNPGLCVVTTRENLADLRDAEGVRHVDLEHLSAVSCRALLRIAGVRGEDRDLEQAAVDLGHHALAITLLAPWLQGFPDRNISHMDALPPLGAVSVEADRHPRRVMVAWAEHLRDRGEHAALALLHVLGLFDRPAELEAIRAIIEPPVIEGLGGALRDETLNGALEVLRAARLVARMGQHAAGQQEVDTHPLVREHFGARLREAAPEAWLAAQERLYRYFLAAAPEWSLTLEEMEWLFRAVAHGCAVGRYEEVRREVYWRRILLMHNYYIWHGLGAFAADLAVQIRFFVEPWTRPQPSMSEAGQAMVLGWAGFSLRALGQMAEAQAAMEAFLDWAVRHSDSRSIAIGAGNLSELLLVLGQLESAEVLAREAIVHADQSGDPIQHMVTRAIHADALHLRGQVDAALALFAEAECTQAHRGSKDPLLDSVSGYRFGDLLLTHGQAVEAQRRAEMTLARAEGAMHLLYSALDRLLLGRAFADLADFTQATHHLNAAVTGLRKAGQQQELPRGLLARAALHRRLTHFDLAHRDLAEAHTIATRGDMRLHLCDYHLESARLHLAQNHLDLAREHHAVAHAGVHAMGYHRRDPELAELAAALGPPRSA